jgi:cold shock CspA family protein
MLTGTVRWWKDDKGYGRASTATTGTSTSATFPRSCRPTKAPIGLQQGQRVQFEWLGATAANERRAAVNVRVAS